MKKIISLFMALVIVMSMFVACSGETDPSGNGTPAPGADATPAPGADATPAPGGDTPEDPEVNEYEQAGLPDGLKFNDQPVYIMCWNSEQPEYEVSEEELDGDPINDAIYKRNLYTEQLLDVDLEFILVEGAGNVTEMAEWCSKAKSLLDDPNTPLDILSCYSRTAAQATIQGLNQDLTAYENLNLDKEWWPKNIQKDFAIKDGLFFITGDISTNVLHMMYAIFYNKTLASEYGIGDLVQLVKDKEWTIDVWTEMTKGIYDDIDNVPGKSTGDFFGAAFQYYHLDSIVQGAGFKFLENTDEGIKFSDELFTDVFGSFVNYMGDWVKQDGISNVTNYEASPTHGFLDNRVIFEINRAQNGFYLQDTDIDYGILPPPMLDPQAQNYEYVTSLGNPYSIYSMARYSRNGERAAAVLQALGFYGYTYTTPAIFDITFKGKFSKQEDVMEMWNTIRNAVSFDLGILYMRYLSSLCDIPTREAISTGTLWENVITSRKQRMLEIQLGDLNTMLDEVLGA